VSRGLVQECFAQLIAEGYLESRVGSATRVAPGIAGAAGLAGAMAGPGRAAGTGTVAAPAAPGPEAAPKLIADFRSGVPDLAAFPRGDWVWAMKEACNVVATADLDYGDPRGSPVLRRVVAGYARRVRAAVADPDLIVVCTGFAQGLSLS